jgi:hypothetical protein
MCKDEKKKLQWNKIKSSYETKQLKLLQQK